MSISFTKYVKITSGVGGGNNVRQREMIARLFTTNPLVDPASVLEFTSAADVGAFFGTSSEEYKRAVKYFGFVSPLIVAPSKISFARFVATDSPARVFGAQNLAANLATLKAIVAGSIEFQFGSATVTVTGISFAAATSLADVASELQTALRANAQAELANCTVAYDVTNARFTFTATATGVTTETFNVVPLVAPPANTDVAAALAWYETQGAALASASTAVTPAQTLANSDNISSNFGSFAFLNNALTSITDIVAVATANAAYNIKYMYHVMVKPANYIAWSAALLSIASVGLTYELDTLTEYPEMLPMAMQAATDYSKTNSVANYMYKQMSGITPSVTTDALANALDAARVNYYGQTQTAGQQLAFYQDGVLMGTGTAPTDMNVHANEQDLKDFIGSQIMTGQLSLNRIPANLRGIGIIKGYVQAGVNRGLNNGTISIGKPLSATQKAFITNQTNDGNAWQQVQNIGYWYDVVVSPYTDTSGATKYKAVYTLIYSKDDAIRVVEGSDQLI